MRMQIGRSSIRNLLVPALIGLLALPAPAASNAWKRVQKIKPDTWVYVGLVNEKYFEGWLRGADAECMTIRAGSRGEMILPRASIQWIAVDRKGRRWYSIPLAIIAGAAGGAASYSIVNHASCSDSSSYKDCSRARGAIVGFSAGASAGFAYYLSLKPSTKKVIYEKS